MINPLSWILRQFSRSRLPSWVPTTGQCVVLATTLALGTAGIVEAQTTAQERGAGAAQTGGYDAPASFAALAADKLPAVVNVSTTQKVEAPQRQGPFGGPEGPQLPPGMEEFQEFFRRFFENGPFPNQAPRNLTALGSGFIIDPAGYVVTNNHVVADADQIKVILHDDTELTAKVVGTDPRTDLALLKVESDEPLPAVTWGNSDNAKIGDWVVAIGNPFGLGGTVTSGIISARARDIHAGPYDDFIQTDAAINRGNSGGPLFNTNGEVIGVNTAIFSPSGGNIGIGFAIPSEIAKDVISQLRQHGSVQRGYLGVTIQEVTDDIAEGLGLKEAKGALVSSVVPDSPASAAGVHAGDVIVRFAGKDVPDARALQRIVADTPVNEQVNLTVIRDGQERVLSTEVALLQDSDQQAGQESPDAGKKEEGKLGLALAPLTPESRQRYQIGDDTSGALVVGVDPGSVAAEKHIAPGDVIVQVGQQQVKTPDDVIAAIKKARESDKESILLLREREGNRLFVSLPLAKKQQG